MSAAEREQAIAEAIRAGFDLSIVDSNFALSPNERALRHDSALQLVHALREAGSAYAQSSSGAEKADSSTIH
jgi:hypothetical protein